MIPRPSFELLDHNGRTVTSATFKGSRCFVFFGFTHCQVVCPRALAKFTDALGQLGEAGLNIQGLYISVDPERDTPERLKDFLKPHPRFLGLTGTVQQCASARESFGVFVRRRADPSDPKGYEVPHSSLAYLLAGDGSYVDHWLDATPVEEIVRGLKADQQDALRDPHLQETANCCRGGLHGNDLKIHP